MARIQHLIVDEFGSFVAKHQGRLRVTCQGEQRLDAPIMHLETVLVTGKGVSLSSDVVAACAEEGIPIHFLDSRGQPVGSFYSAGLAATIATRRAQLTAQGDGRGLAVALAIAEGKIRNQVNLLKYMSKNRKEKKPETFEAVRRLADDVQDHLAELDRLRLEPLYTSIDGCRGQLLSMPITTRLRNDAIRQLLEIRQMVTSQQVPPPTPQRSRCVNCEFRRFCNDVV